mgnify:CR=1 FL=1
MININILRDNLRLLTNFGHFSDREISRQNWSSHQQIGRLRKKLKLLNLTYEAIEDFTDNELIALEIIIKDPKYSHAFIGKQFISSALTADQRKAMVFALKKVGIPIGSSAFGLLGEQIKLSLKNAVDKRKTQIDESINTIDSTQSLQLDDYKKLTYGSALNTVSAVADVLTFGTSTAPKIVIKLPSISSKLAKIATFSAKATPLM